PPPPPPANVPPLEETTEAKPRTVREILTQHRADPVCASCHSRIDPLGFALENYDVLGVWRNTAAGKPVDASGELPDGTRFEGAGFIKGAGFPKDEGVSCTCRNSVYPGELCCEEQALRWACPGWKRWRLLPLPALPAHPRIRSAWQCCTCRTASIL